MDGKKVLVVYYSRTGNTKKVAEEIARLLDGDLKEIRSAVAYPEGFFGFTKALYHSISKKNIGIESSFSGFEKYDLVVVGGPMWAGSVSSPMRRFLNLYSGQMKNIAYFFTQGGHTNPDKMAQEVQSVVGKKLISILSISAMDFRTESFRKKAKKFCEELKLQESKIQPRSAINKSKEDKRDDFRETPMHP